MSCSRSIWLSLSCPELKASLLRLISSRLDSWGRRRRWYHISGNYHKLTRCWASPISVTSHDDTPVTGHSADNVIGCTRTRALGLLSQTTYLADDLCSMQQQFLPCGDQSQDFPVRNIDWDCLCYNKLSLWLVTVHLLTLAPAPTWEPRVRKYWDMSELLRDEGCPADDDVTQHMATDNIALITGDPRENVGETRLINLAHTFALATRLTLHVSFHPNCLKIPPVNIVLD